MPTMNDVEKAPVRKRDRTVVKRVKPAPPSALRYASLLTWPVYYTKGH